MGIVNDHATDLKFAFWNQRINDNFTGTVWAIAKESDSPVTGESVGTGDGSTVEFSLANTSIINDSEAVYIDGVSTTDYTIDYATGTITFNTAPDNGDPITADYNYAVFEDISFSGTHLDGDAIEAFAGEDDIRLRRWYRQDESGGANDYLEQDDWERMPDVVLDAGVGRYVVKLDESRDTILSIIDTGENRPRTDFFMMKHPDDINTNAGNRGIIEAQDGIRRYAVHLQNREGSSGDPLDMFVNATTTNGDPQPIPDQSEWGVYTAHLFRGMGDPANETISKFKFNGTQFGEDFYVVGADGNGLRLGGTDNDRSSSAYLEGVLQYYAYLDDSVVNQIEDDLMALVAQYKLTMLFPEHEQTGVGTTPEFSWEAVDWDQIGEPHSENQRRIQLQVTELADTNFENPFQRILAGTDTSYQIIENVLSSGTYHWRVTPALANVADEFTESFEEDGDWPSPFITQVLQ